MFQDPRVGSLFAPKDSAGKESKPPPPQTSWVFSAGVGLAGRRSSCGRMRRALGRRGRDQWSSPVFGDFEDMPRARVTVDEGDRLRMHGIKGGPVLGVGRALVGVVAWPTDLKMLMKDAVSKLEAPVNPP